MEKNKEDKCDCLNCRWFEASIGKHTEYVFKKKLEHLS